MEKRDERLRVIKNILTEMVIESQEQLLEYLKTTGRTVTQATLSRDLRTLQASKMATPTGGWRYIFHETPTSYWLNDLNRKQFSIAFNDSLGVIKTLPGHANAVAVAIDKLQFPEILGTIAGDDTILLVLKKKVKKESVIEKLFAVAKNMEVLS